VSGAETRPGAYAGYALDLDGTVYLGEQLLPGARETIAGLRGAGRRVIFLTNNPLLSFEAYAVRLIRLGVPTEPDAVVNSSRRFVATNCDPFCPVPGGGRPDLAAVIAAFEASDLAASVHPEFVLDDLRGLLLREAAEGWVR
jgi:ribonucleotide monophosphatase NagD (HAD superfamily)